MSLTQYITTSLLLLWNMIVFLCPIISLNYIGNNKKSYFPLFKSIYNSLNIIYKTIKEVISKKTSKQTNNDAAPIMAVSNGLYKNQKAMLKIIKFNNTIINQAIKFAYLLYTKRLKDALATQILISNLNQHIIPVHAKIFSYRVLMIQLYLSYIKACSDNIKKVMNITQDKCAYLYPFVRKNHCSQYNF